MFSITVFNVSLPTSENRSINVLHVATPTPDMI